MGFWGKLGGVLKKAAPIAAAFIPGVGPLASAAIGAGLGAATSKGGLKNRLIGTGLGAIPTKGIGPSSIPGLAKSTINTSAITGAAKGGVKSALGNIAKQVGKNVISGTDQSGVDRYRTPPFAPQGEGTDWKGIIGGAVNRFGPSIVGAVANRGSNKGQDTPVTSQATPRGGNLMRGLGPTMGRRDQNNPNLAESIGAGRQTAMRDQGFRKGYDVKTHMGFEEDEVTPIIQTSRMPRISGASLSRGRRREASY